MAESAVELTPTEVAIQAIRQDERRRCAAELQEALTESAYIEKTLRRVYDLADEWSA